MTDSRVVLWGREIGAVTWLEPRDVAVFQYAPEFVESSIQVAPIMMPLRHEPYEFPSLASNTFLGLPGLLADSLPDKFGSALIDSWLAEQNRTPDSLNPVERLRYIGTRGMGALEYLPVLSESPTQRHSLEIAALVDLADRILNDRRGLHGELSDIEDILRVGTSAGGARAKAILAWNEQTGEFRSGQLPAEREFTYWLMKFDGVEGNRDKEIADPQGFGLIEYAYYMMALDAGIAMMRSRLQHESGRSHFMTQRFDRSSPGGEKIHMQTLCAMMHYDFNHAGAHSYEQAIQTMLRLQLSTDDVEQQFRRAVFNVIARNQDDHVKNIAFLMDKAGTWRLSPAYDVAYSYNPSGAWTSRHQMSLNGKRDAFDSHDFLALAANAGLKRPRARRIVREVDAAVERWTTHAKRADIHPDDSRRIQNGFRRGLAE